MDEQPESSQPPSKGYGKRPVWQWVVIYVIVAAVVYGVIYYFMKNKGGSSY